MKTNDEHGRFPAPGEVAFVRLLPGPIDRVWAYLTDSEKRGKWLAAGPMEVRPGGEVRMHFHHASLTPHVEQIPEKYRESCSEGSAACDFTGRVTRCEPPRLLAYTWGTDSEVTFELTPKGDQVLLVLTHRRLGDDPEVLASVAAGWHTHLAILDARLAEAIPPPFWATHSKLDLEYSKRVPGPAGKA
jgi:uncharacterized protein YndB with AHSA1/START domain